MDRKLAAGLGAAVRRERLRRGLTQAETAEQVGVATEVYGRLERGRMLPSVPTLRRICQVLDVSADALLLLRVGGQPPMVREPELSFGDVPRPRFRLLVRRASRLDERSLSLLAELAERLGSSRPKRP